MEKNTILEQGVAQVQRNYKDTVFRMIFKDKRELLALYNAINDTSYDSPDELEIKTLENAIYMSMKNDVSFVIDMVLSLYEHQSTVNPNLPLRDLDYVSRNYVERVRHYQKTMSLKDAVTTAVDECINEGILADFLKKNKSEVISMSIFEYDEKLHEETMRKIGKREGRQEGEERMAKLYNLLLKENRLEDWSKALEDKTYKNKLFEELNL